MHDVAILAVKGLAGGLLVLVFAAVCEGLSPKRFAGLFGAAPAVAIASLTITLLDKGAHDAHENSAGMLAGAAGMIVYAMVVVAVLRRRRASKAAALAMSAWVVAAALVAVPVMVA